MSEEPTYYEKFGSIERRWRKLLDLIRLNFKKDPVYLIEINWRLGDEIMAIPFYEALYKDLEASGTQPIIHVWANYPDILIGNPYIKSVNVETVKPDGYILLRDVSKFVFRNTYYREKFRIRTEMTIPKMYFSDWNHSINDQLPNTSSKKIALCPGASWPTKRWGNENWKNVCRELLREGFQVIELGNSGEAIGVGQDFTGKTSVKEVAHLLHDVDLAVTHDSGLMHLSLAAGTRTLALFGPTDPGILIQDHELLEIVTNQRECAGCWNRPEEMVDPGVCPLNLPDCMEPISVEKVVETILTQLTKVVH
jgi:hypothetical protein